MDKKNCRQVIKKALVYREVLLAYSYGITRNWTLSEEAVQNTFVYLSKDWKKYREGVDIFPWLRSITRLRSLDVIRSSGREVCIEDEQLQHLIDKNLENSWSEGSKDELNDQIYALRRCMADLPSRAQEMLWAHYANGDSYENMAANRKRNVTYIANQLFQIRKKLRRCISSKFSKPDSKVADYEKSLEELFNAPESEAEQEVLCKLFTEDSDAAAAIYEFLMERTALAIVSRQFDATSGGIQTEYEVLQDPLSSNIETQISISDEVVVEPFSAMDQLERGKKYNFLIHFGIAACLIIGVGLFLWNGVTDGNNTNVLAMVDYVEGEVIIISADGTRRMAGVRDSLNLNERISSGDSGAIKIRLADRQGYLEIGGKSEFVLKEGNDKQGNWGKRFTLEVGELTAEVTRQKNEAPMVFATLHAELTILGTRFRLKATSAKSELSVAKGLVRFDPNGKDEPVLVSAGQFAAFDNENGVSSGITDANVRDTNGTFGINLLKNPDFELSNQYWKKRGRGTHFGWIDLTQLALQGDQAFKPGFGIDNSPENAHSGDASLKMMAGWGDWVHLYSDSITVVPGGKYKISGWLRFEALNENSGGIVVRVACLDENGGEIYKHSSPKLPSGVHPFKDFQLPAVNEREYANYAKEFRIVDGVNKVSIVCAIPDKSAGIAYIDDLEFVRIE